MDSRHVCAEVIEALTASGELPDRKQETPSSPSTKAEVHFRWTVPLLTTLTLEAPVMRKHVTLMLAISTESPHDIAGHHMGT